MKLSILICSIPSRLCSRAHSLSSLISALNKQVSKFPDVELLYLGDNKKRSVGQKRNDLLKLAQGEYVVFIDDDDVISIHYVDKIYEKLNGVDAVVFDVEISENEGPFKKVTYGMEFTHDANYSDRYERLINHLMVVKREHALATLFPEKTFGEDAEYAIRLKQRIKTQERIQQTLYWYVFNSNTSETRG